MLANNFYNKKIQIVVLCYFLVFKKLSSLCLIILVMIIVCFPFSNGIDTLKILLKAICFLFRYCVHKSAHFSENSL